MQLEKPPTKRVLAMKIPKRKKYANFKYNRSILFPKSETKDSKGE